MPSARLSLSASLAMPERLQGRTALVTGASRGIGAGIAERLAAEGADVALVARTLDEHPRLPGSLRETAAFCEAQGARTALIVADLADAEARADVVATAAAALGAVDIVVNNAAGAIYQPMLDYPLKRRRLMVELNVQAPVDLAQAALPAMIERGEGWIVNLSSATTNHPQGPPYDLGGVRGVFGWYGATKSMLDRVTTAMASELHGSGVRVNAVQPRAAVLTEGADAVLNMTLSEEQVESLEAMVEAALWLCDCPADHTGRIETSLDLLSREAVAVMSLDGKAPHPGGFRR